MLQLQLQLAMHSLCTQASRLVSINKLEDSKPLSWEATQEQGSTLLFF